MIDLVRIKLEQAGLELVLGKQKGQSSLATLVKHITTKNKQYNEIISKRANEAILDSLSTNPKLVN